MLDKCLYEPLTISIASSFNCISSFARELKAIDKAILQTVQGLNPDEYTVLNSIPGISKVYSAGILAEIGFIKAFPRVGNPYRISNLRSYQTVGLLRLPFPRKIFFIFLLTYHQITFLLFALLFAKIYPQGAFLFLCSSLHITVHSQNVALTDDGHFFYIAVIHLH